MRSRHLIFNTNYTTDAKIWKYICTIQSESRFGGLAKCSETSLVRLDLFRIDTCQKERLIRLILAWCHDDHDIRPMLGQLYLESWHEESEEPLTCSLVMLEHLLPAF